MRVRCVTNVLSEARGPYLALSVGKEYPVLTMWADARHQVLVINDADDDNLPSTWDARMFETVDTSIPSTWVASADDQGFAVGPAPWLERRFWARFWGEGEVPEPGKAADLRSIYNEERRKIER